MSGGKAREVKGWHPSDSLEETEDEEDLESD